MPRRHHPDDHAIATGRVPVACLRPTEVDPRHGDASTARRELGRVPRTTLEDTVNALVHEDRDFPERQRLVRREGFGIAGDRA